MKFQIYPFIHIYLVTFFTNMYVTSLRIRTLKSPFAESLIEEVLDEFFYSFHAYCLLVISSEITGKETEKCKGQIFRWTVISDEFKYFMFLRDYYMCGPRSKWNFSNRNEDVKTPAIYIYCRFLRLIFIDENIYFYSLIVC